MKEVNTGFYINNSYREPAVYKIYELNLDKVNSLDDYKKILRFLCNLSIKSLPEGITYNGFCEVEEYFK